jgi:hypothetical protein
MSKITPQKQVVRAVLFKKWVDMWSQFETEFTGLPKWAQEITLQDIGTAVQSRLVVMQKAAQ